VKEESFILHTIKFMRANLLGHILHKIVCVKHVIEEKTVEKTEVTARRGRLLMQLLDELKEERGGTVY
jgi:hypothetical protein